MCYLHGDPYSVRIPSYDKNATCMAIAERYHQRIQLSVFVHKFQDNKWDSQVTSTGYRNNKLAKIYKRVHEITIESYLKKCKIYLSLEEHTENRVIKKLLEKNQAWLKKKKNWKILDKYTHLKIWTSNFLPFEILNYDDTTLKKSLGGGTYKILRTFRKEKKNNRYFQ